jgi:hypothetical protein
LTVNGQQFAPQDLVFRAFCGSIRVACESCNNNYIGVKIV